MRFVFSYARLLQYYHQQEEIARRDHNESLNRLENEKKIYHQMFDLQDEVTAEIYNLRQSDKNLPIPVLGELTQFLDGHKHRMARQREVVINHTSIVEQKQEILISAVKEMKIFEKLRERQLKEFKEVQRKREAKRNDEVVVTRFKRGEER